ncbi:centromere/kinetochore protein Zw10 [Aspergillus heteromorphus CBS 117.55]|uniref:Centromere/kinetochore protein Zw10 n=1 Tax=Aspergillus heteromorphus CBS 117.55 TaxID=1448321 RepID=A0A317WPC0_9EURO|nr:centromere/kinetochore protein Zw10 [Aspergillus heteromorphus CBS 117.55]PWY86140.1 centromere/kinetochore protein Zw10 [Aspergillus heteromorphus CBS 117.55]
MSGKASEQEISQSVLDFVKDGAYPDSELIVASGFPISILSKELELISKAREQVEAEISFLSRENNFDADGWISQAKQLHADIERSRVTAREIVEQHEKTNPLQLRVEDASAKVDLIETEIAFNQAVASALKEVQSLCGQLDEGRTALDEGRIMPAIEILEATEQAITQSSHFSNTNVLHILLESVAGLRKDVMEAVRNRWNKQLNIDKTEGKMVVSDNDGDSLEETIVALTRLQMFSATRDLFQKDAMSSIVDPILLPAVPEYSHGLRISGSSIHLEPQPSTASVSELLDRIVNVLGFMRQSLPPSIADSFSDIFIPNLSSKIIEFWLSPAIPTELEGLKQFEENLDHVLEFTKTVENYGWHGQEELVSWINHAPRLWLARRRVDSLDQVRKILAASQGITEQVERVEVEKVSESDGALLENATSDDWDAGWDDDNDDGSKEKQAGIKEDEEDVSAWGLDDDTEEHNTQVKQTTDDDDEGDAWGWGDDDEEQPTDNSQPKASVATKTVNGKGAAQHASPREVILREKYTITDIPNSILGVVRQQVKDSEVISQPVHSHSRIISSGTGLLALPTLILAMFKATASTFYGLKLSSGQMYLYNDSLYLADQVRNIMEEHQLTRLQTDIDALEKFGKFAYSKEMQTQRTIVTDLLDGAQGFSQCSEQPFLGECENAIGATVDRIRDVFREWQPILSHSALLQSIGSLVSTMISKIIIEIEDLGDISEPQSQRLVSFCNQVTQLEDLFIPEALDNTERLPMTAVYVRNWLKFQYLVNILESSLADIKFLWVEGELRLEFSPEEVVDLIEALFAESDYRRKAIADIRRASRGQ